MHPMLNNAVKAARRAGTIINRASLDIERLRVSRKDQNDFVTEVDQACEAAIIEILSTAYPAHGFLGEETGLTLGGKTITEHPDNLWIIDPLDGTTNFIHGMPVYAVSIALMQKIRSPRRWSTTQAEMNSLWPPRARAPMSMTDACASQSSIASMRPSSEQAFHLNNKTRLMPTWPSLSRSAAGQLAFADRGSRH
jgi:Archaeal fructose-1,6-bisphosphatase and related enzymes of inositol monophosphatase family